MSEERSRVGAWTLAAGILATGWAAWILVPHRPRVVLASSLAAASSAAVTSLAWSALLALALRLLMRRSAPHPVAAGIWLAPATLLAAQFSPAGILAGLALAAGASRLLCASWSPEQPAEVQPRSGMLQSGSLALDAGTRWFLAALAAAVAAQAALACVVAQQAQRAGGLAVAGAAMFCAAATGAGAWAQPRRPDERRSALGLGATALAALLLASLAGGGSGNGTGGSGWASAAAEALRSAPARSGASVPKRKPFEKPKLDLGVAGNYPGVILWPEIEPVTMLVAPLPRKNGLLESHSLPLNIPFGGEYWMFRFPFHRPPPQSFFRRGKPTDLSFSTTDRALLQMEAHQKLEQPLRTQCCRAIQIAIRNADLYPRTVWIELVLVDPNGISQSLGLAPVTSTPELRAEKTEPVPETLEFAFPPAMRLVVFDELTVIFHRSVARMHRSARIAIDRFLLTPRG